MPDTDSRPPPVTGGAAMLRLAGIAVVLALLLLLFLFVGGYLSPRATPARFMQAFQSNDGAHPGFRRAHAKGLCVTGSFDAAGDIGALSSAVILHSQHVPVIARFALGVGMPDVADSAPTVRSLALRLLGSDGSEWRTGMNDIPVFIFNTAQGFYDQLRAAAPDPHTGKPDPAAMQAFLGQHPETGRAFALIKARPVSADFSNDTYNSLNAFRLGDASGRDTLVRWAAVPVQPFAAADLTQTETDKNYLFKRLLTQLKAGPLQWHLVFTVAAPGDSSSDSTVAWPASRRQVDGGLLTLDHAYAEDDGPCTDITYDPLVLPPGIEASDDPILSARSAVYARSLVLRDREKPQKSPAAVSPQVVKETAP
jgi:catalase